MIIERLSTQDWLRYRAIRLRALLDAPNAFNTTWADDYAVANAEWKDRLEDPATAVFVATRDRADHGRVRGGRQDDHVGLYSMWVSPDVRWHGVAGRLIEAVADWAWTQGHRRILLDVADETARAIALYERLGFVPSSVAGSLPPPREHIREHQRMLTLR